MKLTWAFEVDHVGGPYYWALDDITLSGNDYTAKILKESFSGVTLRLNLAGNGLISPNELYFEVSDKDNTIDPDSFVGDTVVVRVYEDEVFRRGWKFKVTQVSSVYGKVKFHSKDFLHSFLENGDFPLTEDPELIWPSENETSNTCIPEILGQAYIPVESVYTGTDRYYVIGSSDNLGSVTFTVDEVQSPHDWNSTFIWGSGEYSFNQSNLNSEIKGLQAIIADSNLDGVADANGVWISGDSLLPMLVKMSRSDTVSKTSPSDWVRYFLNKIGITDPEIDATSFSAADTAYGSLEFNGGWWVKDTREKVLSNILAQSDSYLSVSDKVELYRFSKTSTESFDNVKKLSFNTSKITKSVTDSGGVIWQDAGKPQDVLSGKTTVSAYGVTGSQDNTDGSVFEAKFIFDSQDAQRAAILYYNKKHTQKQKLSFSIAWPSITTRQSIRPGNVVTINNALYGGLYDCIITDIKIRKDFAVEFEAVILESLLDWGDLTPPVISVGTEDTFKFQPPTKLLANIACKINYDSFTHAENKYLFIHGFSNDGLPADENGTIAYDGDILGVPRAEGGDTWTVKTSIPNESGYIVFDTTMSGKFTVATNAHSVVFAKPFSDGWKYDNGVEWVSWVTASTDTSIGTITTSDTAILSANVQTFGTDLDVIYDTMSFPVNPIAYWKCNEGGVTSFIQDYAENSYSGVAAGTFYRSYGGENNLTIGIDGYADFGLCEKVDEDQTLTIVMAINLFYATGEQGVITKYNSVSDLGFSLYFTDSIINFLCDGVIVSSDLGAITAGVNHILRIDHASDNKVRMYLNDTLIKEAIGGTITSVGNNLLVGRKYSDVSDFYMDGSLKNIQLYNSLFSVGGGIAIGNQTSVVTKSDGLIEDLSFGITGTTSNSQYDMVGQYAGGIENYQIFLDVPIIREIIFPENFVGSVFYASSPPSVNVYIDIMKDTSIVCSFIFLAGVSEGVIHGTAPETVFFVGNTMQLRCRL